MSHLFGAGMNQTTHQDISSLTRLVQRRQRLSKALSWFVMACCWIGLLAVVLSLFDRIGETPWVPWSLVILIGALSAVGIGVWGFFGGQPGELDTAREIDGRLGLKDRLSTAIACRGKTDPFSIAVMEDAVHVAAKSTTRESVRRRFPLQAPAFWWCAPLLLFMAFVITMFGQWDLVSPERETTEVNLVEVRQDASDSVDATVDVIRQDPMLSEAMTDALEKMDSQTAAALDDQQDEQSIRREALKRVTLLNQELEQIVEGPEGQAMDAVEKSLGDLEAPDDSSVKELVEALSKSEFEEAAEAFSTIQEKIESGEMTDEEREQVANDLRKLTEQLDDMASDTQSMEDVLKQAGLDPDLADDSQAMKQAIEQADQLNESQKESLQEMAESKEQSSKMLKELAEASDQACKQCQSPGKKDGQPKEGQSQSSKGSKSPLDKGQKALDEMAGLKRMLEQARSAQQSCQSQCEKLGQGLASQQALNKPGQGQGEGPAGRSAGSQETATSMVARNDAGQAGDGPVVSRTKVDQPLNVGESKMTLGQAQQISREGFDEAMQENLLPRQYHDALKHYFADPDAVDEAIKSDADANGSQSTQEQSDEPSEVGPTQEAGNKK
tara:strand:+ start:24469 stop:26304 length:1836 start_codon:yes stop_codon:yes gene_type:complete